MTTPRKRDTELDVVVFGATGFTGRLVAEVLAAKRPAIRWAIAGRSRDKLERVRSDLARIDPSTASLPILVGDSLDPASVDAMVARTRVVCTTIGPFARYGRALVAACAERGVDYCDITGEPQFVRAILDAHHERAIATGARIVPCCGFDSIPSDLGVLLIHEHLKRAGKQLASARLHVKRLKGAASGGTLASVLGVLEQASDPAMRRAIGDPYALMPKDTPRGPDRGDQTRPRRDADTGRWTAPFMMAAINTRIVRRSNALSDFAYGRDFRYAEVTDTGRGPLGFARAAAVSAGLGAFVALATTSLGRKAIARVVPSPGEGPSREERERGSFRVEIHAKASDGERLRCVVEMNRDPGYGGTSIMLAESALCLAEDDLPARGGVLTTATCMGTALVERLRAAGMTFRVE